jgi:hypothetical protein
MAEPRAVDGPHHWQLGAFTDSSRVSKNGRWRRLTIKLFSGCSCHMGASVGCANPGLTAQPLKQLRIRSLPSEAASHPLSTTDSTLTQLKTDWRLLCTAAHTSQTASPTIADRC